MKNKVSDKFKELKVKTLRIGKIALEDGSNTVEKLKNQEFKKRRDLTCRYHY